MDRMIVAVFDSEAKAYEGLKGLQELDREGSVTVYSCAVIAKDAEGKVSVRQAADQGPWGATAGLAIGALVGMLGGPAGMALGALGGSLGGSMGDLSNLDVDATFLDDTAATLTPGKSALVAALNEEWVTPLDSKMEALGGVVLRRARNEVSEDQYSRQVASVQAELKQYQAELAQAGAEQRDKLQARVDDLNKRLTERMDALEARREAVQREGEAKLKALQERAKAAGDDMRSRYDSTMQTLREEYNRRVDQLKV